MSSHYNYLEIYNKIIINFVGKTVGLVCVLLFVSLAYVNLPLPDRIQSGEG